MEKDDLREALMVASILVDENPCRMKAVTMGVLANAIKAMVSDEYCKSFNQDSVARYYGVTSRTVQRWAKVFSDFPKARNAGDGTMSYSAIEVVRWKRKHPEVIAH